MPNLRPFNLPRADARLLQYGDSIFKFTFEYKDVRLQMWRQECQKNGPHQHKPPDDKAFPELPCSREVLQNELEAVIKCVIQASGEYARLRLQTKHFLINCKTNQWKAADKLRFAVGAQSLRPHPTEFHIFVLPKLPQWINDYEQMRRDRRQGGSHGRPGGSAEGRPGGSRTSPRGHKRNSQGKPLDDSCNKGNQTTESIAPRNVRLLHQVGENSFLVSTTTDTDDTSDGPLQPQSVRARHRPSTNRELNKECTTDADDTSDGPLQPQSVRARHRPSTNREVNKECQDSAWKPPLDVCAHHTDRATITQADLLEEMKLQQLASPSAAEGAHVQPPPTKRRLSLLGAAFSALVTPIKKLFVTEQ